MLKLVLTNKKINWLVILGVFFLLAIAGGAWAINAWNEGYRVNHSGATVDVRIGSATGLCQKVTNSHATNDYFVPTKTQAEWDAFSAHPPSGITIGACYSYAYTAWSAWSACSSACSYNGTQTRTRSCQRSPDLVIVDCSFCGGVCSGTQGCGVQCYQCPAPSAPGMPCGAHSCVGQIWEYPGCNSCHLYGAMCECVPYECTPL